jgi:hypothetical protein
MIGHRASAVSRHQPVDYYPIRGFFGPAPTEQVSLVLDGHGANSQYAHDQEDQKEYDGDYEDWHTSPLLPVWDAIAN